MEKAKKIRHPKKRAFLAAYAENGNVTQAAEIADVDRSLHYVWLHDDETYADAFKAAQGQAGDRLEQEARRRAIEGVEKPVFYKGEECGRVQEYSDTLLIFLMKGAMPDKYKERVAQEHSGHTSHDISVERMSDDELHRGITAAVQAIADLQARTGTPSQT